MIPSALIEQWCALSDPAAQTKFLHRNLAALDETSAIALKDAAIQTMRGDTQKAMQIVALLHGFAESSQQPRHKGYALWAEALVRSIGLSQFQQALVCYDDAIAIFQQDDDQLSQAIMQVSRIWSLANLGRHEEAFTDSEWAGAVLEAHTHWLPHATLHMNSAIIHSRLGDDAKALVMLNKAQRSYQELDLEGELWWAQAEHNRAIALRNLGRFEESIQASERAHNMQTRLGHEIEAARALQGLGLTHYVQGRYNEALRLLAEARDIFLADGLRRHAVRAELYINDCLLQLRRFAEACDSARQIRTHFRVLGTPLEEAQAALGEALAYAGLNKMHDALDAIGEARALFEVARSPVWMAYADLEAAILLHVQGLFAESTELALPCSETFAAYNLPIKEAEAYLVMARAATALGRHEEATRLLHKIENFGEEKSIPTLRYQACHLAGLLAKSQGDLEATLTKFEEAIESLERLRGAMMVEHRISFQEDKQILYEDMVDLCLELNRPAQGLEYAERAKSRALLELLAYRLDLSIAAAEVEDRPLVAELMSLRARRAQLQRRQSGDEEIKERGWTAPDVDEQFQQQLFDVEKRITQLWHTLLVRRAEEYTQDAALWQVRAEPVQPYLDADTALLEYFVVHGKLVLFFVTAETIEALRLPTEIAHVQRLSSRLGRNLRLVARSSPEQIFDLSIKAEQILQQLFTLLLEPLANKFTHFGKLIIVPHGLLHYLPFHAFHSGQAYMVETHEICYLPSASLLRYGTRVNGRGGILAAFGHTYNGQLPFAAQEARSVAGLFDGRVFLDDAATCAQVRAVSKECQILHLATHAVFHPDEPLFSGIALADRWLTTLDIFNLKFDASLVTLSACQTGRSVVGGGDELLGLMRAFLYAGASSLLLSLWAVEDRSTATLMEAVYRHLAAGHSKGDALRRAQLQFIRKRISAKTLDDEVHRDIYGHPYFWAPFFLVGHAGPILQH